MRRIARLLWLAAAASAAAQVQNSQAIWIDVPFVQQPREGCGAASISMVMQYWAKQAGQPAPADSAVESIQQAIYSPRAHGILASSMQEYLQRHGYKTFALSGRWDDFEAELRKGRPLIVGLRPEGQRALHYVVVVGVDPARGLVTIYDPAERKMLSEERAAFEKEWSATGDWMLLAVPASAQR